jgi:glycosyltransferase involved in cell wall biosynthesis
VLVCWNHERFVRAAVLSVLSQTHRNIQLIVFENGSTDSSRAILEELQKTHDFTLVCQENVGIVRALNAGLKVARGEYFTILATDDIWLSDKVERQVAFLRRHPDVHMVSGLVTAIDENDAEMAFPMSVRTGEVTFADLMARGNNVLGPTVMCRTSTLRNVGGYDESVRIEDYSLALRMTHEGHRVVALNEVFTRYRRHSGNWTARSLYPDVRAVGQRYRHLPEYRDFVRHNMHRTFRRLAATGQKRAAMELLRSEPIPWTWDDVGVGFIFLLAPAPVIALFRRVKASLGSTMAA